jgi:hypothetical protein
MPKGYLEMLMGCNPRSHRNHKEVTFARICDDLCHLTDDFGQTSMRAAHLINRQHHKPILGNVAVP